MKPNINVTPLIDVLLVLLIIFMVVSPSRPSRFETKLPAQPKDGPTGEPDPNTLIVFVRADGSLSVNREPEIGSIADPEPMVAKLTELFRYREANGIVRYGTNEVEKTVFINAPKTLDYGTVVTAIDAVKRSGAAPIALQLDDLN